MTQLERSSIFEGESIALYINGSGLSAKPDTSSLWQDFKIIATTITEGSNHRDFRIRMMLEPRRTGTIFIPSFNVGDVQSELTILNVLPKN